MPQDAPADTAGPSSPPPQLPDGWLPQWEGVQRKWYFVQRATGKSQWEIPTEPVVLTPSTTPTSIGAGPTYPPSRPSTNSPVTGTGTTLAERIEAATGGARFPNSLDSQLNDQLDHSIYANSEQPQWHPNQASQQMPQEFRQQFLPNENQYGSQPYHKYGPSPSVPYPDHGGIQTAAGQHPVTGYPASVPWGENTGATQVNTGGYSNQQPRGPHTGFELASQHSQQPVGTINSTMAQNHFSGPNAVSHPPEPQWHPSQQPLVPNAPSDLAPARLNSATSQPSYRSYPTPQTVGASPREFPSRQSQSSNPSYSGSDFALSRENSQSIHNSLPMHSPLGEPIPGGVEHPMSRRHSQQRNVLSPQGSHMPGVMTQSPHGPYQATNMLRTQSGVGYNPSAYSASEAQGGAHNYQNPLVQAGIHQYIPTSQQAGYKAVSGDFAETAQSTQASTIPGYRNQMEGSSSIGSRSAASDPQFVSGPWSSTPPVSGPPQPPRYE